MKRNAGKALLLTSAIIVLSALMLYALLSLPVILSGKLAVHSAPQIEMNVTALPGITDEDYKTYPLFEPGERGELMAPSEITAELWQSDVLQKADAAVLAAKQVENITGKSFKDCKYFVSYYNVNQINIRIIDKDNIDYEHAYININAVTGMIKNFSVSYEQQEEQPDFIFPAEDISECVNRSKEIGTNYFPHTFDLYLNDLQNTELVPYSAVQIGFSIDVELTLSETSSILITFYGSNKDIVNLSYIKK